MKGGDSSGEDDYSTDTDAYDDDFTNDYSADDASRTTVEVTDGPVHAGSQENSTNRGAQPKASPQELLSDSYVPDAKSGLESKIRESRFDAGAKPLSPSSGADAKCSVDVSTRSPQGLKYRGETDHAEAKVDDSTRGQQRVRDEKYSPGEAPESKPPYISVRGIELSEVEAKYLYGLKKSEKEPSKIVIVHQEDEKPPEKATPTYSLTRMEELARPRDLTATFAKYAREKDQADQKQRGTARRKKQQKCGNFMERMETMEKQRRTKIERRTLELKYEAKPNKKVCPNCGGVQSFDEYEEDRLVCPSEECAGRFKYQSRRFVLKKFEKRMQRSAQRRYDSMEKIIVEQQCSRERGKGKKSRRQKELLDKVEKSGKTFLDRMSDDIGKRKVKISRLEIELQEQVEKKCTFKPQLNISDHLLRGRVPRDETFLSEPKHRKTDERSRRSGTGGRGRRETKAQRRNPQRSLSKRPSYLRPGPTAPKRRMAAPKDTLPDPKMVAKKFKKLLL